MDQTIKKSIVDLYNHVPTTFQEITTKGSLPDFKETRIKLVTSMDPQEIYGLLDSVAERWGNETIEENNNVYGI